MYFEEVVGCACKDCCGGISKRHSADKSHPVSSVRKGLLTNYQEFTKIIHLYRLLSFLENKYGENFLNNICILKIDTDGHDVVILEDLKHSRLRPPIIYTEWFLDYKFIKDKGDKIEEVRKPKLHHDSKRTIILNL